MLPPARPNIAEKEAALVEKALGRVRDGFGTGLGIRIFGNAGFWRLKAPKTNISLVLGAKLSSRDQVGLKVYLFSMMGAGSLLWKIGPG